MNRFPRRADRDFQQWDLLRRQVEARGSMIVDRERYSAISARLAEAERLLRDWLLADDRFDLEAWVRSVRDYVEDTADNDGLAEGCHRSHPHENMDAGCRRLTAIARDDSAGKLAISSRDQDSGT